MIKKIIKLTLGFLIAVLVLFIINTLYSAGVFKQIISHTEGRVKELYTTMPGTEDMDIDYSKGLLFISSTDRWKQLKGGSSNGGIYILQLDSGNTPKKLAHTYIGVFQPHGISFISKHSVDYLFVVNHNEKGNFVELFQVRNDTLFHQKTFADASMCCPNDVVGVDTNKFYVTNDHGNKSGMMRVAEDYLRIPKSYLLYFDGTTFSKAYDDLNYGNGVNISKDGSKLYLTQTTGRKLLTFNRNSETGKIELLNTLNLASGLDNIHVDDLDNLWIAAHPKMLKFVGHAKDSTKKSPSQVFKLTPYKNSYRVEDVYVNDGTEISGSSIAVQYKNDLLIGVVFERKLLRIALNKKP